MERKAIKGEKFPKPDFKQRPNCAKSSIFNEKKVTLRSYMLTWHVWSYALKENSSTHACADQVHATDSTK